AAGDPGAFLGAIPASTDDPGTPAPANPSSTAVDGVWASLVQQTSPTPEPRASHAGAYDSMRNRMLVFGGRDPFRSDVWALTLGGSPTWSKILPVGAPPSARELHAAIYDPVRDRLLVFGGWDGGFLNDVWSLSLGGTPQWT